MKRTYQIDNPIRALYDSGRRSITLATGRYTTSDRDEHRFLKIYPGVTLLSEETESPAPLRPGEKPSAIPPSAPLKTLPGVQIKERRLDKWTSR